MTHLDPTVALLAARLRLVHLPCQTMRTIAGMLSGSTSSTFRWSWLIWLLAKGVMG